MQQRLMLLLALLLAAQAGLTLLQYFGELEGGGRFGGDFISFWKAAHHARGGDYGAIYDPAGWERAIGRTGPGELSWFVYPPFALFGLWPLGGMAYNEAALWWSVAPLPFYFAFVWLLARRSLRRSGSVDHRACLVAIALTLPFLSANLFTGQTGAWIAVVLLAAAYFWPHRLILAGIFIGLVAIKPQLGLLLPFALAASGQWRTIAAAAATIVALVVAGTAWLGTAIWSDYLAMTQLFGRFIGQGHAGIAELAVGPYVSLRAIGVPPVVAGLLQAAVSVIVIGVIVRVFRQQSGVSDDQRFDLRLGLLAVGTLLATPYSLAYDTPLLALAIIPLLARAWRSGWAGIEIAAVTALLVLPFIPSVLIEKGVPFGLCALLLAFAALHRRYALEGPSGSRVEDETGWSGPAPLPQ